MQRGRAKRTGVEQDRYSSRDQLQKSIGASDSSVDATVSYSGITSARVYQINLVMPEILPAAGTGALATACIGGVSVAATQIQ